MDAHAPFHDSRSPVADGLRAPASDDAVWHGAWAVGMATGAAFLLFAVGAVSAQALWALGFMAAPGIVGAFWRPGAGYALLGLWALGAALAVCLSGGLTGPLAVFCLAPAFAALATGGSWRAGAGLSIAVVGLCALAEVLHLTPAPAVDPARIWLTLIALTAAAAAAGSALLAARRRAERERRGVEDELAAFQTLMGDLPELGLALDADGRTQAVFGQPVRGLDSDLLHAGLLHAADSADRSELEAAIDRALTNGEARTTFSAAGEPDRRIAIALQRTSVGGLLAILRAAPSQAGSDQPAAPNLADRLAAAEADRREAEIGRDKAEANAAARARFLANMSHELRTPLNAIMGFSDMMRAKMFGELQPKYAEYADLIHESGGHLLDLINDVLDMSKIEAQRYTLAREVFDVRDALNAALRLMRLQADDAGVKLRAELPGEPLPVDADKRAIKQILLNLLSNALKFTPKHGTVILSARAVGADLEIVVADTGMGIAADDLNRLGQPFEQAGRADDRARGAGLGLSLVDAFAKLHGGRLSLESRLGEGTAATVRMPILVPSPSVIEPPVMEPPAAGPVSEPGRPGPASTDLPPVEPHSLRQTVVDMFAHRSGGRSSSPPVDEPPGGPRPHSGGVQGLS